MKPMEFKEQNKILTKPSNMTDDECQSMPVFTDGANCISCWKMGFKDKLKAIIFGKLWIYVWSGKTQPPIAPVFGKTVFEPYRATDPSKSGKNIIDGGQK